MTRLLLLDAMNFIRRSQSGFGLGPRPVTFNFFRNLRSLVETLQPTSVTMVLEGKSERKAEFAAYKANRAIELDQTDPESIKRFQAEQHFRRQADECVDLVKRALPIRVVRHPRYEADDVIYTLAKRASADETIIASSDSDFIQVLSLPRVKLWNIVEKSWVEPPPYDYVSWKSLKGDATDNIPGLPGVGVVTAEKAMADPEVFWSLLAEGENRATYERNLSLIRLRELSDEEMLEAEQSGPSRDWVEAVGAFKEWQFASFFKQTKSGTQWDKFKSTLEALA